MKLEMLAWTIAMTSCAALVAPVLLPAQERAEENRAKHHRYSLVDIGTFGGPESNINPLGNVDIRM